ncbi:hypothetical protein AURDEDRAFT_111764 [Auricularia subglabra TFB-10046 SS5]|nr:hypothetical protein AURDEDRAFT_111764 [Auricularia subglabra TFB-10046 SS5]
MTMTPSSSALAVAPAFEPARVAGAHLAEAARAIHIAFARAPNVQYALCGAYALALLGCPRPTSRIECIIANGKFGAVKRILPGALWWHPRVAAGAMTSYYTTHSGVAVEVRWYEAGIVGPRRIAPGPGGTVAQTSAGVCALNATQLLRAAIKAFAKDGEDADADSIRWLAAQRGLHIDLGRALAGLEEDVSVVLDEQPNLRTMLR